MSSLKVEMVAADRKVWEGEAKFVRARSISGELGILPGHTPLLGALAEGFPVRIDPVDGASITVNVTAGFLSVRPDGVSVLAESAELASGDESA